MISSKHTYFPKVQPPEAITLGIRASTYEMGGGFKLSVHNIDYVLRTFLGIGTSAKIKKRFYTLSSLENFPTHFDGRKKFLLTIEAIYSFS